MEIIIRDDMDSSKGIFYLENVFPEIHKQLLEKQELLSHILSYNAEIERLEVEVYHKQITYLELKLIDYRKDVNHYTRHNPYASIQDDASRNTINIFLEDWAKRHPDYNIITISSRNEWDNYSIYNLQISFKYVEHNN